MEKGVRNWSKQNYPPFQGLSNISQTTLNGNRPNCLIIFLNIPFISQATAPTHLNIEVSYVIFGKTSKFLNWGATGLGIMLAWTAFNVNICINKFKTYSNMKNNKYNNYKETVLKTTLTHWRFQSCQVIRAGDMCHSRVSLSNDQNFTRAMPGLARIWNCQCPYSSRLS